MELDVVRQLLARDRSGRNGDDAAVVRVGGGELCVTVDVAVGGRHLHASLTPWQVGYRAAACALSDVAAMGGAPVAVVAGVTVPEGRWDEAPAVSAGVDARCREVGAALVGGDLVAAPAGSDAWAVSVTCLGAVGPADVWVSRAGAREGDVLLVTGSLGHGLRGLRALEPAVAAVVPNRYLTPPDRTAAGQLLARWARAMLDVSDGVAGDVRRIAEGSGCGAALRLADLPLAPGIDASTAASWGDDYELLVAVPTRHVPELRAAWSAAFPTTPLTEVGRCTPGPEVVVLDPAGSVVDLRGHEHGQVWGPSGRGEPPPGEVVR